MVDFPMMPAWMFPQAGGMLSGMPGAPDMSPEMLNAMKWQQGFGMLSDIGAGLARAGMAGKGLGAAGLGVAAGLDQNRQRRAQEQEGAFKGMLMGGQLADMQAKQQQRQALAGWLNSEEGKAALGGMPPAMLSALPPEQQAALVMQTMKEQRGAAEAARWAELYGQPGGGQPQPQGAGAVGGAPPAPEMGGKRVYDFFVGKGYAPHQAAALAGQFGHESAYNPAQTHDGGSGIGLAGWRLDRRQALERFAAERGKPATDFNTQLEFADAELRGAVGGEGQRGAALRGTKNVREATDALMSYFRPAGWTEGGPPSAGHGYASRLARAQAYLPTDTMAGGHPPQGGATMPAGGPERPATTYRDDPLWQEAQARERAAAAIRDPDKRRTEITSARQAMAARVEAVRKEAEGRDVWSVDPQASWIQRNARTGEIKGVPGAETEIVDLGDGKKWLVNKRTLEKQLIGESARPDKEMTEYQAQSAMFADRMKLAHKTLNDLEMQGTSARGAVAATIPVVGNMLQSPDYQQYRRAKEGFLNALLRRESGAVIADSEFAKYDKEYFPQPGDDPKVIADKRAAREAALSGMIRGAGAKYGMTPTDMRAAAAPAAPSAPAGGAKPQTPADLRKLYNLE